MLTYIREYSDGITSNAVLTRFLGELSGVYHLGSDTFMKSETEKRPRDPHPWAKVTALHLDEIRRDYGLTVAQFAAMCRGAASETVGHSSVVAWRNGMSVPGGVHLRQIAEKFEVTTDWILGIKNASKYPVIQQGTDSERSSADAAHLVRTRMKLLIEEYLSDPRWENVEVISTAQRLKRTGESLE